MGCWGTSPAPKGQILRVEAGSAIGTGKLQRQYVAAATADPRRELLQQAYLGAPGCIKGKFLEGDWDEP